MEHYLQAHALNPQAQWHHWRLYFGLQRLAGLESPRLLEFCQRIVDLVKQNYHHYPNRGFTPLLLSTAYRYLGEGDVATQKQAQRARTILHQSYRAILEPDYPELINHAWTQRRNHPPNFLIIGVWKCGTTSYKPAPTNSPTKLPTLSSKTAKPPPVNSPIANSTKKQKRSPPTYKVNSLRVAEFSQDVGAGIRWRSPYPITGINTFANLMVSGFMGMLMDTAQAG
ncbi:hypothetical protein NG791_27960 [Laspinema sp. D1]|uniref:hypothetical protein n=1 Tax=Laspinema palackyanum TaxID=3231601 RepID=UPI0034917099|nr:hypothetical protein [Laspinema sp. D2b]